MKDKIAIFCLLICSSFYLDNSAQALPLPIPQTVSAKIVNFGIYKVVKTGNQYSHEESTAGYAEEGIQTTLVKSTTKIPLRKGIAFGFEWEAEGFPRDTPIKISYRIRHPETTKPDGTISSGFDEPFPLLLEDGKIKTGDYYQISEDWELLPGEWCLSVVYENNVLFEKVFYLSDKY